MTRFLRAAAMLVALLCLTTAVMAAKPKPKPKPAPKPNPTNRATLGTTQLKGEYAEIGSTYTLGKGSPINVTLKSVEFTLNQVVIGDQIFFPKAEEKLLVVHYNLHNPQAGETLARYDYFSVTVVDSKNENHEYIQNAGVEATKNFMEIALKPGQKVDAYLIVPVPAKGEIPKMIFKSSDNLVLRYDLKGKVKPLVAPYADPADPSGASALANTPAKFGTSYPLGEFNFNLEGTSLSEDAIAGWELAEGNRYLALNATVKNASPVKQFLRGDAFAISLKDVDGSEVTYNGDMLLASRDKPVETDVSPGQELKVRILFQVPKDVGLKTLAISRSEGHPLEYDMSGVK
jgi:hypothetical protein